jgi:tight adherence protein B
MGTAELLGLGTFLAIFLLILGPYFLLVERPEAASRDMLRQRIKTGGAAVRTVSKGLLKEVELLSAIGPLNKALSGEGALAAWVRDAVHMSGVGLTAGQVVLGSGCLALLGYVLTVLWIPQTLLGLMIGGVAGFLPFGLLLFLRSRRLGKFEAQFPEAVDLIARTLRAGHAFTTGLRMVADEIPEPIATEFRLLHDQQTYGLPVAEGLRAFARRVPLIDTKFFVTAVLTQRESGGNLAEVLDNLSAVIRERFKVKRQLAVISAHGRLTGAVLGAMPPILGLYLLIRMPDHFTILLENPAGVRMIMGAVFLQILGVLLIYKITKVDY